MNPDIVAEYPTQWMKDHLPNVNRTPEERRFLYRLCRLLGDSSNSARVRRNWWKGKIARVHGYTDYQSMITSLTQDL